MSDEALNDYERTLLRNVEQYGCHITSVLDPDGIEPPFSYSIGFPATIGQSEVIVCGLSPDIGHFMINEVLVQCRGGLVLRDWTELDGLLADHTCVARVIPPHRIDAAHFNSAIWFERYRTDGEMTAAFQIVWPGAGHGMFPWQDGADLGHVQPALYEPRLLS